MDLIIKWMFEKWKTVGEVELIAMLCKFLMFIFTNEEDMRMVLELRPWFMGRKGLALKKWHLDSRTNKEIFNVVPVWISLPELPSPF